jgi:tol-pal system protein YbgF
VIGAKQGSFKGDFIMRQLQALALLAAALLISPQPAQAQGLGGRFMFGFGGGAQQLYSDRKNTGYGFGGEGVLGYRLSDRLGVTVALGYATLPFNLSVAGVTTTVTPNLIYGNLLFDIELINSGKFHPYLMFGAGGYNFKVQNSKRFNDGAGIGGLGFRYLVSPNVALNVNGAYHYTTADNLDALVKGGNDAYFSGRLGLTFFKGGSAVSGEERELFTDEEQAPVEEAEGAFDEFAEETPAPSENESDFASRLEDMDNAENAAGQRDMQEYIRLKSQVDELNQDIDSKEREISSLLEAVTASKQQVKSTKPAAAQPAPPVVTGASFSRQYEQALQTFYLKRYADAIQMFTDLLERFPTHSLASSCQYWIGEANFHAGNYQAAVAALNQVLESARSMKKDDALLYLGQSYAQLNRKEDARQALNRLLQEYPTSEYASKAEALLRKM